MTTCTTLSLYLGAGAFGVYSAALHEAEHADCAAWHSEADFHVAPLQKSANILLARDFTAKVADVGEGPLRKKKAAS